MYFIHHKSTINPSVRFRADWDACAFYNVIQGGNPYALRTEYERGLVDVSKIPATTVYRPYQRVPSPYLATMYIEGSDQVPKLDTHRSSSRERSSPLGWRNALKNGTIVVKPMVTSYLQVTNTLVAKPGVPPDVVRYTYFNRAELPSAIKCGRDVYIESDGTYNLPTFCPAHVLETQNAATLATQYFGYTSLSKLESAFGPTFSQAYVDGMLASINAAVVASDFDQSIVTACIAETRNGAYDLLTELAEMPETLQMIMQLVTRILGSYRDTVLRIAKLEKLSKAIQLAEKRAKRAQKTGKTVPGVHPLKRYTGNSVHNIAKEVASDWLLFRYGIAPSLMSLQDAIKLVTKGTHEYAKFRRTTNNVVDIVVGDLTIHDVTVTTRAFGKLRVDGPLAGLKLNVLSSSLEKVPMALLLNWVMNIGDCLTALIPAPGTVQEVYSVSRSVRKNTYRGTFRGRPVQVTYGYYRLDLISPEANINLQFANFMTWKRTLDAFAFIYAPLRKAVTGRS